VRWQIRYAFNS